jgi:hypothetical protein
MNQKSKSALLKVALIFYTVIVLAYGIGYAFFPGYLVELSGNEPFSSGWLRWSGGVLIALGIGAILVTRYPHNQRIFVLTISLGTLFTGLALIYQLIIGAEGKILFSLIPCIITLLSSVLLWWAGYEAKDILGKI